MWSKASEICEWNHPFIGIKNTINCSLVSVIIFIVAVNSNYKDEQTLLAAQSKER